MPRKLKDDNSEFNPESQDLTFTPGGEGDLNSEEVAAVRDALAETAASSQQAEEALMAEGVSVKPVAETRRERTRNDMVKAAKRQREYGRRLLGRHKGGIASLVAEVRVNNLVLAASFERFFPIIDQCAYLLSRNGAVAFGERAAEQLIERMNLTAGEILTEQRRQLEAAKALVGELSVNSPQMIVPTYTQPAYQGTVQIKSPQGACFLEIFKVSDALLEEIEVLHWNQMRSISERNDEVLRAKRKLFPMFTFAASTIRNLERKMRERFAGVVQQEGDGGDGTPTAGEEGGALPVVA